MNSILSLMYLWFCEGSNDTQQGFFSPFVSVICNRISCHKDCDQNIMKNAKPLSIMARICKLYILFNYWRTAFQRDMHCSKEASQHLSSSPHKSFLSSNKNILVEGQLLVCLWRSLKEFLISKLTHTMSHLERKDSIF